MTIMEVVTGATLNDEKASAGCVDVPGKTMPTPQAAPCAGDVDTPVKGVELLEVGEAPCCPRPYLEEEGEARAAEAQSELLHDALQIELQAELETPSPSTPERVGAQPPPRIVVTTPSRSGQAPRPYLEVDTGFDASADVPQPCCGLLSPVSPERRQVSLDLTPLSCKSTDSTHEFHQPCQTIIILDWDDTLCPSTAAMRQHGLSVVGAPPSEELQEVFDAHAVEAAAAIERARELASKVVIVTNAEEGWVDLSCRAWLPTLRDTLALCEVASARSTWEPQGVHSPAGWKAREFEAQIERFYSQYERQSWKNIVSVGDAPHEREALTRVAKFAPTSAKCRSKSVKLVLRPSIEQLTKELQMLRENLGEIVFHDGDLDLHFNLDSLNGVATPLTPSTSCDTPPVPAPPASLLEPMEQ